MKQFVLILFLVGSYLIFPSYSLAAISLEISNYQKQDDFSSVDVVINGIASSSAVYVQAVFTAPGDPHYFGETWGAKGEWIRYLSSPDKEFIKNNFPRLENGQKLTILLRPDISDSDYKGPGEYLLKLRRYTGESTSAAGDSNILIVTLSDIIPTPSIIITQEPTQTATPTQTVTPSPTNTPTPTATPTPSPNPTPTRTPTAQTTPVQIKTPSPTPTKIAVTNILNEVTLSPSIPIDVLGDSTESAIIDTIGNNSTYSSKPEISGKKPLSKLYYYVIGGSLIALSSAVLLIKRLISRNNL